MGKSTLGTNQISNCKEEMELDRPSSQEANTTYHATSFHEEPKGKGKAKKHLAQRSRSRCVKSRMQMERAGSPSQKPCLVERSR